MLVVSCGHHREVAVRVLPQKGMLVCNRRIVGSLRQFFGCVHCLVRDGAAEFGTVPVVVGTSIGSGGTELAVWWV